MSLKTSVYITNVTNLSDARYCAGMGVERLGFVMDKFSDAYVSPEKLKEIKSWLAGVKIVGQTQSADYEQIMEMFEMYEIDAIQISAPQLLPSLASENLSIILKVDAQSAYLENQFEKYTHLVEFFLVEVIDLTDQLRYELKDWGLQYPILLDLDMNVEQIEAILADLPIKGIAIKGGAEERPGYKNFDELIEILETLEVE
jgi:phosphoribosylanthranilate isomerase